MKDPYQKIATPGGYVSWPGWVCKKNSNDTEKGLATPSGRTGTTSQDDHS